MDLRVREYRIFNILFFQNRNLRIMLFQIKLKLTIFITTTGLFHISHKLRSMTKI